MNIRNLFLAMMLALLLFLPGCDVVVGIFKAGFWTAVILMLLIAGLGWYGYRKMRRP